MTPLELLLLGAFAVAFVVIVRRASRGVQELRGHPLDDDDSPTLNTRGPDE